MKRGELTNAINRVVENINHSFTRRVVERTFKSHDIAVTEKKVFKLQFAVGEFDMEKL